MAYIGIPAKTFGSNVISAVFNLDTQGRIVKASNVATAIPAISNVNITLNRDYMVCLANANTGTLTSNLFVSNTQLYFNPSTATLTSTNFNSVSDVSLKNNVIQINNPLSFISQLSGVEFNWKDNGQKASGFIAQDVEKTLPHLVSDTSQGIKTVNYQGIIAYLVETIKELNSRLKEVEKKLSK
jgi:hypothetical protein